MENFPPLLVILMVIGGKCALAPILVGRLVNIVCVLLTTQGILFCCLKLYKSRFTALMSALLVCSLPKIYLEGCGILRDPLYWAEEVWMMYIILQIADSPAPEKHSLWRQLISLDVLCGLTVLTRKEGAFLFILISCVLAFVLFKKVSSRKTWLSILLVFPVGVAIIAFLPYCAGVPFVPLRFLFERLPL